jgi:hypothetical protein
MMHEDHELEEKLRTLTTAGPPEQLRGVILDRARRQTRGRIRLRWALALGVLLLLAIDAGVERVQAARIDHLIGNRGGTIVTTVQDHNLQIALVQQRALLAELMHQESYR